jgi:hypothetical protein
VDPKDFEVRALQKLRSGSCSVAQRCCLLLQDADYVASIQPLLAALAKEAGDKHDAASLARVVAGMLQFQEDVLGANVSAATP